MNSIQYFDKDKKLLKHEEVDGVEQLLLHILNSPKLEKPYGTEYTCYYHFGNLIACLCKDDPFPTFNITPIKNDKWFIKKLTNYYPESNLELLLNLTTLENVTNIPCNPIKLPMLTNIIFDNKNLNVPSDFYEQEESYLHFNTDNYLEIRHSNLEGCVYLSQHALSSVVNYCFNVSNDFTDSNGALHVNDIVLFTCFDEEIVESFCQLEEIKTHMVIKDLILPVIAVVDKQTKELQFFYAKHINPDFSSCFDVSHTHTYDAKLLLFDKVYYAKFTFVRQPHRLAVLGSKPTRDLESIVGSLASHYKNLV